MNDEMNEINEMVENNTDIVISTNDCPEDLLKFLKIVEQLAEDYKKAVNEGVKKRATEARKALMEIKKMTTDMRKAALESKKS